ncbi:conserved hypothetical protein [Culex quinquefasciatus]|uniref:Uncharacterized protein n=1 Tax=Culex quinquefasciatus TaxID=7176 RepID=B0XHF8_CULQU|nr:conserved hypothetical protein [Culex quinquefasciatus]|eukprot:XP_001869080.1 conserved hypothetical protein [Culex quinquefasciatus]
MFRLGKPATAKPICLNGFAALPTEHQKLGSRAAKLMSYADPSRRRSGTDEQVEQRSRGYGHGCTHHLLNRLQRQSPPKLPSWVVPASENGSLQAVSTFIKSATNVTMVSSMGGGSGTGAEGAQFGRQQVFNTTHSGVEAFQKVQPPHRLVPVRPMVNMVDILLLTGCPDTGETNPLQSGELNKSLPFFRFQRQRQQKGGCTVYERRIKGEPRRLGLFGRMNFIWGAYQGRPAGEPTYRGGCTVYERRIKGEPRRGGCTVYERRIKGEPRRLGLFGRMNFIWGAYQRRLAGEPTYRGGCTVYERRIKGEPRRGGCTVYERRIKGEPRRLGLFGRMNFIWGAYQGRPAGEPTYRGGCTVYERRIKGEPRRLGLFGRMNFLWEAYRGRPAGGPSYRGGRTVYERRVEGEPRRLGLFRRMNFLWEGIEGDPLADHPIGAANLGDPGASRWRTNVTIKKLIVRQIVANFIRQQVARGSPNQTLADRQSGLAVRQRTAGGLPSQCGHPLPRVLPLVVAGVDDSTETTLGDDSYTWTELST